MVNENAYELSYRAHGGEMTSLIDSDDSSCSEKSINSRGVFRNDGLDDDAFTVATVLDKRDRPTDSSRRDTITRTMPTISIHDKYAIPTTVQKTVIANHQQEERSQLRVTESLMDDSSESENDTHEFRSRTHRERDSHISDITTKNSFGESIFRTPSEVGHRMDDLSNKSTTIRRNTVALDASIQTNLLDSEVDNKESNLLDVEVDEEDEIDPSLNQAKQTNRRHRSDTFMSVYEDLAAKRTTTSTTQNESNYATARGAQVKTHVKTIVRTALKSVADGLAAHATSNSCDGVSWDVEQIKKLSGNKHSIDMDGSERSDDDRRNRRKSLNIRAELTLMQDMMHDKTEECDSLKQVSALFTAHDLLPQFVIDPRPSS